MKIDWWVSPTLPKTATRVMKGQCDFSAALALAATVAGEFYFGSTDRRAQNAAKPLGQAEA